MKGAVRVGIRDQGNRREVGGRIRERGSPLDEDPFGTLEAREGVPSRRPNEEGLALRLGLY